MKIYLCQLNPTIGDIRGNKEKILQRLEEAKQEKADMALFPEMALTGYPPQDLLLRPHFIEKVWEAAEEIGEHTEKIHLFLGLPRKNPHPKGKPLYNSCAIFANGHLVDFYDKILLPTYDVFDERRYFEPGGMAYVLGVDGKRVAVTICEDLWEERYATSPVEELRHHQVDLLINLSASPFHVGKHTIRQKVVYRAASTLSCPVLMLNQVGGNDTLIFDGRSFLMSPSGAVLYELPAFKESCASIDLEKLESRVLPTLSTEEETLQALSLGLKDFCHKLGFSQTIVGISGGIDSALVAAIAVHALGKENVRGFFLPSRYTSKESVEDAAALAAQLGISLQTLSIDKPNAEILRLVQPSFASLPEDITEENIQSRLRGLLLMAFANKYRSLLLNTGNKSEYAVGYCTLYGDMCGALSVIGDLTKRDVYSLARHLKIPQHIVDKEPSAELKPDQKDADYLPSYAVLDTLVALYIEEDLSPSEIATKMGLPLEMVLQWCQNMDRADFKRHQAPPILRVSKKSLSFGRHFPIVKSIHT